MAAFAAGLAARAQTPGVRITSSAYVLPPEVARVEPVQIEVVVRGADGNPIAGLGRRDFRVKDDGHAGSVRAFTAAAASRLPLRVELVVDDLGASAAELQEARQGALELARAALSQGGAAALLTTSGVERDGFTTNVAELAAALGRILPAAAAHPQVLF
ncbi:MAG: hypothetical protein ACRD1E_01910, partial [Terriglobales bacterium]